MHHFDATSQTMTNRRRLVRFVAANNRMVLESVLDPSDGASLEIVVGNLDRLLLRVARRRRQADG
jgi:hypothetical protein